MIGIKQDIEKKISLFDWVVPGIHMELLAINRPIYSVPISAILRFTLLTFVNQG